jgi:hypothetical protein
MRVRGWLRNSIMKRDKSGTPRHDYSSSKYPNLLPTKLAKMGYQHRQITLKISSCVAFLDDRL